ncbi:MAG: nucleotide exchange factor GrpE [Clostridia bacterium]|nr:nucleotide exchange factor GrpE [Clostridia bacterium]
MTEMMNQDPKRNPPYIEEDDPVETEPAAEAEETAEPVKEEKTDKKSDKKLKNELADMEKKLEAEKKRADELNDKYLRTAAEYENFRRRSAKERETVYGEAVNDTLTGLLPILDNLQYAAKFTDGDAEKFVEGVKLILGKLPETLEQMNIKMFGEPGETFNPEIHNAVMHIDDENYGEGEITDVLQCGYMYGDKVLRYAMVRVAN